MLKTNSIYQGDCLELMKEIPDASIDFICVDVPYGITACAWDKRIPFAPMWSEVMRVAKDNAAIAMFAKGKFLIELASSNLKYYRYKWVWHKNLACGFLNAKKMPLCAHEDILIFYRHLPTYNPQFTQGKPYCKTGSSSSRNYGKIKNFHTTDNLTGDRYPTDLQKFKTPNSGFPKNHQSNVVHSTQKPVDLLEYLIKTYSNAGEVVLDFTCGSGSTCVAAVNSGRQFIGIELDEKYFEIACDRVVEAENKLVNG